MPRHVTLVLTGPDGQVVGALPEFVVDVPWWPEAWPLVDAARERHGLDLTVLRLLDAPDSPVPAGGHVAYLAEVPLAPSGDLLPLAADDPLRLLAEDDHPRRAPWARPGGVAATLAAADGALEAAGRPRTGPARQVKSWNLSSVLTLPTAAGPVWCKSVPAPLAHEADVVAALAGHAPGLAPPLLGAWAEPGAAATVLLADAPGEPLFGAPVADLESMVRRWVDVQAATTGVIDELAGRGVPDRRAAPLLAAVRGLAARPDVRADLAPVELDALDRLVAHLPGLLDELTACGLPDVLVHGDLHPGNWVGTPGGAAPVLIDWGDSVLGHPAFDAHTVAERVEGAHRDRVLAAWAQAWRRHRPASDPLRAVALAGPPAALRAAGVYRGFLDAIERTERRYHDRDPAAMIRYALARYDRLGR